MSSQGGTPGSPAASQCALPALGNCARATEPLDHRVENGNARQVHLATKVLKIGAYLLIDQGEDHRTGMILDSPQHHLDLVLVAHHRPEMLDHLDTLELNQACARDAVRGFAGRIGNQVEVQFHVFQ